MHVLRTCRFGARFLVVALLVAPAVQGQELTGVVRDGATGRGLGGAVVTGLGTGRRVEGRVLTSSSGAFRLSLGGATQLRVVRIGYRPWEMPLDRLASGALTIELIPIGNLLDSVVVHTSAVCPARRDQREALALWATAQDGLLALAVASASAAGTGELTQILFERRLESDGRGIYQQSTRRVKTGNAAPIRAGRDAATLAESGYVERTPASMVYYAPDPATLLDESFAATHCLSIRRDPRGHPGLTGIGFTPTTGRDTIADISGVLWLSRVPLELRSLEFEYVGVDPVVRATRAGGRLDFVTLSNGVPIIRFWQMRTPRLLWLPAGTVSRGRVQAAEPVASVASLHENGALIASGTLADGTTWSAPLAALAGRVVNARTGGPVPGARVLLDSTDHATVSDPDGRFTFEGLLPGPYVIRVVDSVAVPRVHHPDTSATDSSRTRGTGIVARVRTVHTNAALGDVRQVEVRLPWRDALGACEPPAHARRRFIVVGTVATTDRTPLSHAAVRLVWSDSVTMDSAASVEAEGTRPTGTVIDALADAEGRFVVCGIPGDVPVSAQVRDEAGQSHEGSLEVSESPPTDERGRRYRGPVRFITLVVTPARRP